MTDKEILDWIDANPNVKFQYNEKNQFFGPHWRVVFGPKSAENRHQDFRSVVRYAKEFVQQLKSEISEEELQRLNNQVAQIWGTIFQQHSI